MSMREIRFVAAEVDCDGGDAGCVGSYGNDVGPSMFPLGESGLDEMGVDRVISMMRDTGWEVTPVLQLCASCADKRGRRRGLRAVSS